MIYNPVSSGVQAQNDQSKPIGFLGGLFYGIRQVLFPYDPISTNVNAAYDAAASWNQNPVVNQIATSGADTVIAVDNAVKRFQWMPVALIALVLILLLRR